MKGFLRFQTVYQVMGDALLLFGPDFGGPDIHMPVDLHGIRGDDFSAHRMSQPDGETGFPDRRRTGQNNKRLLFVHLPVPPYTIRLNFFSSSRFVMEIMVGLPWGQW